MKTYAYVQDGVVRTVGPLAFPDLPLAEQMAPEVAQRMVNLTTAQAKKVLPGWLYDGGTFSEPPQPPVAPSPRICTPREFRSRFTAEEKGALTLAASRAMEASDPALQVFLDELSASQVVELDHPDLITGMDLLVSAKLLTRKRADAILAA